MSRIRWYGPSIVLLLTTAAVMFFGPSITREIASAQTDGNITRIQNDLEHNNLLNQLSKAYTEVAKSVEPSVVNVEVLSRGKRPQPRSRQMDPNELRRWFFGPGFRGGQEGGAQQSPFDRRGDSGERGGQDQDQGQGQGQSQGQSEGENFDRFNPPRPLGNGAGWVYDKKGHIITNNHVVAHADEVRVTFYDGSKRDAQVVGTDPHTDVAVLKVDGGQLHPAKVTHDGVTKGEVVFAFGSPFRFNFSMSQGIVSAQGRRLGITGRGGYERFIQTDAAVNPGNSGGPLVNIKGQVVGMNTAIASKTGVFSGLGFSIPAKLVTNVADQIIKHGNVERGYLGVYIEDLSSKMAKTFNYDGDGALVVNAIKASPAAKAGLKSGDIITAVNGQNVGDASELRFVIAEMQPHSKVKLDVFRKGKTKTVKLKLGTLPHKQDLTMSGQRRGGQSQPKSKHDASRLALRKLGISRMTTLDQQARAQLPIKGDDVEGAVVLDVRRGSIAANQHLSKGDIITAVMGKSIDGVDDLLDKLNDLDLTKPVRFTVRQLDPRAKKYRQSFVVVQFPEG